MLPVELRVTTGLAPYPNTVPLFIDRTSTSKCYAHARPKLAKRLTRAEHFQENARVPKASQSLAQAITTATFDTTAHPHMHRHVITFAPAVQRKRRAQKTPNASKATLCAYCRRGEISPKTQNRLLRAGKRKPQNEPLEITLRCVWEPEAPSTAEHK